MNRCKFGFFLCLILAVPAYGQDRRGEETTDRPEYHGVKAYAPIDPKYHIRNEGGAPEPGNPGGSGLCVISSLVANGAYQDVGDLRKLKESELWKAAKSQPGGYYPGKLEALLKKVMPGAKWFSWEGKSLDLIQRYSGQGKPVAATMNTGALYGYSPIHHMISIAHAGQDYVCVVDNNDPGRYHWMPVAEYARRYVDGEAGWGFVWLPDEVVSVAPLGAAFLLVAGIVSRIKRRRRWSWA